MKKLKTNNVLLYFIYFVSFTFILGIMLCCPKINDDYSFASYGFTSIKEMIHFSLYYGNGRFLGNLTSLLLIGNMTYFAVEKAIILFLIIAILPKVLDFERKVNNKTMMYLASYILVMGMSPFIFQEVITWSTCFQNYVVPVAGTLICLWLIKIELKKSSVLNSILIFVIGFSSQLYLELNTVVNVALSFVIVFLCFTKYRDKFVKSLVFFASNVFGAVTMLIIPKLFVDPERVEKMTSYRSIHLESFNDMKYTFIQNISDLTAPIKKSVILLVIIAVLLCITVNISDRKKRLSSIWQAGVIALPVYAVVFQVLMQGGDFAGKNIYRVVYTTLLVAFWACALICVSFMEKCSEKVFAYISLIFVIISILPVTIVSPAKPRCAFLYYMFLAAFALIILSYLFRKKKVTNGLKIAVAVCAVVLTFNLGINYYNVKIESEKQINDIKAQLASHSEVIEVHEIDNLYMHKIAKGMFGYSFYYKKPFDVEFKYVD